MAVTDPAETAARAAMLANGWPEHTTWDPDPAVAAELDELTAPPGPPGSQDSR